MKSRCPAKNGGMRLVFEDETHLVYSTDKFVRGHLQKENKIFVKGEPHYDIEPSVGNSDTVFLKTTNDNKLIGLLKNGELEKPSDRVNQIHFLSKLNLIPRELSQFNISDGLSSYQAVNGVSDEIHIFDDPR